MKRITLLLLSFFSLHQLGAQCIIDISPGVTENLNSVFFIDAINGIAVGDNGQIIITNNGGTTWNTTTNAHTGQNFNGVFMASPDEAWVVGDGGIIRYTTDGGSTWQQQYSPTTCHLTDVHFMGGNGIIVGECGIILKFDPVNDVWTSVRTTSTENFHLIRFIDDDTAFIAGANGTLFKTTDAGVSWSAVPSPTTFHIVGFEIMGNNGYLSDANGNLFLSNDGGATWPVQATAGSPANAIAAFAPNQAIAVGPLGFVSKTNNAGNDWETLTNPAINGDLSGATFPGPVTGYAVGANGLVVKILFLEIEAMADSLVCNGSPVSLAIDGPGIAATYLWSGPNYSSNEQNPTFNAAGNNSGQYIATADVSGCTTSDTLNLNVVSLPSAAAAGVDLSCDSNTNVIQGNSSSQNVGYEWQFMGNVFSNQQNPSVSEPGTYILTVTDANG